MPGQAMDVLGSCAAVPAHRASCTERLTSGMTCLLQV